MKNIKVVIGANFGDEGKGLLTDYLASQTENGIVVRFNGGAQAGHTVTTPEGERHVFGHFGAGSFCGLPTYLSSFFVVNPMVFVKEMKALAGLGVAPRVFLDKACLVTTVYDVLLNQIAESVRGTAKHGSCGLGFNETITRNEIPEFALTVKDIKNKVLLFDKLKDIKESYVTRRLGQLGIENVPDRYKLLLQDEVVIENNTEDIFNMLEIVEIADEDVLKLYDTLLFEGAQGLLLDQSHKYFPHVTRSNTGIKNAREIIISSGLENENVEIVYVTRAYMTRHGAGPFPTELPEKPYVKIEDLTNVPNPFQDELRYGLLDIDLLAETIKQDLKNTEGLNFSYKLAITCLDHIDEWVDYFENGSKVKSKKEEFISKAFEVVGASEGFISEGLDRDKVFMFYSK